jgi:hypothetical protein
MSSLIKDDLNLNEKLVVLVGDLIEGFQVFGPFTTFEEVEEFKKLNDTSMVVTNLWNPEDYKS